MLHPVPSLVRNASNSLSPFSFSYKACIPCTVSESGSICIRIRFPRLFLYSSWIYLFNLLQGYSVSCCGRFVCCRFLDLMNSSDVSLKSFRFQEPFFFFRVSLTFLFSLMHVLLSEIPSNRTTTF